MYFLLILVLRLPAARSSFADFSEGTQFEPLLQYGEGKEIVILCSGKVYPFTIDFV